MRRLEPFVSQDNAKLTGKRNNFSIAKEMYTFHSPGYPICQSVFWHSHKGLCSENKYDISIELEQSSARK